MEPITPELPAGSNLLGAYESALAAPVPGLGDMNTITPESLLDSSPQATLERGAPNYILDAALGVADGVESFGESITNLGIDLANLFLDEEDDLDHIEIGLIDAPQTMVGQLTRGITQFAIGFVPIAGQVGRVGQAARALSLLHKSRIAQGAVAGAITDFVAFDEHEERLSNLIEQYPTLSNPVTSYLASDNTDSFAEGRLKNAIEGTLIGMPLDFVVAGVKALKGLRSAQAADPGAQVRLATEAQNQLQKELQDSVRRNLLSPEDQAAAKAVASTPDDYMNIAVSRVSEAIREMTGEVFDPTPLHRVAANVAEKLDGPTGFNLTASDNAEILEPFVRAVTQQFSDLRSKVGNVEAKRRALNLVKNLGGDRHKILALLAKDVENTDGLFARDIVYAALVEADFLRARKMALLTFDSITDFKGKDFQAALNDLTDQVSATMHSSFNYLRLGTNEGRALQARQAKSSVIETMMKEQAEIIRGIKEAAQSGNEEAVKTFIRTVAYAENPFSAVTVLTKQGKSSFLERHNEFWINSLLASVKTQGINVVGNSTKLLVKPAELVMGGLLTANMQSVGTGLRTYRYLVANAADSLRMAWKAFRSGDALLDPHHSTLDTTRSANVRRLLAADQKLDAEAAGQGPGFLAHTVNNQKNAISSSGLDIDRSEHPIWAGLVDLVGGAVNLPSKFLISSDEFFKQLNFRARAQARLAEIEGLDIDEGMTRVLEFNEKITDGAPLTPGDLADPLLNLARDARYYAEEGTWTKDLRPGSIAEHIQQSISSHPVLQLIAPFVRTPLNIIQDSVQYTPGLQYLSKTFRESLNSPDPLVQAQARGKQALGVSVAVTATALAGNGFITGSGPKNPEQRRTAELSGWQPNSFVVTREDGTKEYIAYSRLEPLGAVLGLFADFVETGALMEEDDRVTAGGSILLAITRNYTSKTFLFGLTDTMNALTSGDSQTLSSFAERRAASYVPNIVKDFKNDPYLREAEGTLERIKAKLPGYSQTLPPRRNFLGEPITAPGGYIPWLEGTRAANALSPVGLSLQASDPVKNELGAIGRQLSLPNPKLARLSIDLQLLQTDDGRDAYDRYQELIGSVEIQGATFAEQLDLLVASDSYQALPSGSVGPDRENPRASMILQVRRRYARAAQAQLLRENSGIRQAVQEARLTRIHARRTAALQAADNQLLNP